MSKQLNLRGINRFTALNRFLPRQTDFSLAKVKNQVFSHEKKINYCQKRDVYRFTRYLDHKISTLPSKELNKILNEATFPRVARVLVPVRSGVYSKKSLPSYKPTIQPTNSTGFTKVFPLHFCHLVNSLIDISRHFHQNLVLFNYVFI